MQDNPWAQKYGLTPQAPTAPVERGPLLNPKAPDPYKVQQDAESDARADTNTGLSVQSGDRSQKGQVQDFRKEFMATMPVKTYQIAIQSLSNAVKRGEDGSGDVALIYDYAKAMDPESVVRESEVGMAQAGQSAIESAATRFKKEFGLDGGGVLTPETRKRLRREIINAARSRMQAYDQQRDFFADIAERNNFNADDIIGPHLGEPFREELSNFGVSGRKFTPEEMAARAGRGEAESETGQPQAPTGQFASTVNTDALGPGEKFLFDDNGVPTAIQAADGSISGYSVIEDNATERNARQRLEDNGGMDYAKTGEAGFNRGLMLGLSDEIGGVAAGLGSLTRGGEFGKGYRDARDTERVAQDISREEAGILPELAGGLVIPGGALGTAKNIGQFATQGAILGGVGGFGEGRGAQNSLGMAALGSGTGAALGGTISQAPRAANALLQTGPGQKFSAAVARTRPNVDREVIAAGKQQDIPIRLPDAVESKRPAMAALQKTNTGSPRVGAAYAEDVNATQNALGRQVPAGAMARDENTLGKAIQGALERTNTEGKAKTSALFNRVEKMAPGARSDGAGTVQMIDDEIARLNSVGKRGNASKVKALQDMRDDIAESGLTVESLQSLRDSVRQRVNDNNLDPSSADTLFASVDKAATKELEGALKAANPRAVGAFQSANRSHAERLAFRKEVARELLGPKANPLDAEKAATRLMSKIASKGDEDGFKRVWDTLDDAERNDIAATIVENLAGGGNEFSFAKLAQNLEPDKANYRTLRLVFGKDGAEALKDLQLIARRKTQTQRGLNNSNTGSIVEEKGNALMDTILTVFGYTQGGILGAVAGGAARGIGEKGANAWRARLLLKPDFTKWLRQTPNSTSPAVIDRHFSRLNRIASREQAFLMDARTLQEYMRTMGSEGVGKAAAVSDNGEDNGRK